MGRGSKSRADNPSPDSGEPERKSATGPTLDVPAHETPEPANGKAASDRSGHDERRRGWFWHWNGIVTQYAPLIGLKGVGLLNSYTVWTDRREDSPHRGYAFPSQQSEANFYGEDRAELITINKILVALDLIEIRKEMVRKVDEQGRRWKVPQNFYRVKDRPNGLELTADDVVRVIELADRDKAVYRYIRKVFSAKFEPIDHDNVWHQILIEIAEHPTWQKLAARAAKQEARASARTKAGHRSRARQQQADEAGAAANSPERPGEPGMYEKTEALLTDGQDSSSAFMNTEQRDSGPARSRTSVARVNRGAAVADELGNRGFEEADDSVSSGSRGLERGYVADANNGHEGSVEPGNTMYYESSTTTTTTTGDSPNGDGESSGRSALDAGKELDHQNSPRTEARDSQRPSPGDPAVPEEAGSPAGGDVQSGAPGEGGGAPKRGLADAGAGPVGDPSPLVVSLYEAANDRRATPLERILLSELEAAADAPARAAGLAGSDWVAAALREAVGSGSSFVAPKRIREIINRWASTGSGPRGAELDGTVNVARDAHANHHTDTFGYYLKQALENMLGIRIDVSIEGDLVVVRPVDARLEVDDRELVEIQRQVAEMLGRAVRVHVEQPVAGDGRGSGSSAAGVVRLTHRDVQQGEQLWNALLDMLAAEGVGADLLRLRSVVPIGERADGAFVLGASTRLAARLLEGRYRRAVERSLSSLLSAPVRIAVLNPGQWRVVEQREGDAS